MLAGRGALPSPSDSSRRRVPEFGVCNITQGQLGKACRWGEPAALAPWPIHSRMNKLTSKNTLKTGVTTHVRPKPRESCRIRQ